jgi:hypothetical protein
MLRSQVTNKQTGPDPLFLEPLDCNKETAHSDTLFSFNHGFAWNVLQEDDILCELYADTHSHVSDYSDNESVTVTSPLVHVNNCDLLS